MVTRRKIVIISCGALVALGVVISNIVSFFDRFVRSQPYYYAKKLFDLESGSHAEFVVPKFSRDFNLLLGLQQTNDIRDIAGTLRISAGGKLLEIPFTGDQLKEANWLNQEHLAAYIVTWENNSLNDFVIGKSRVVVEAPIVKSAGQPASVWISFVQQWNPDEP